MMTIEECSKRRKENREQIRLLKAKLRETTDETEMKSLRKEIEKLYCINKGLYSEIAWLKSIGAEFDSLYAECHDSNLENQKSHAGELLNRIDEIEYYEYPESFTDDETHETITVMRHVPRTLSPNDEIRRHTLAREYFDTICDIFDGLSDGEIADVLTEIDNLIIKCLIIGPYKETGERYVAMLNTYAPRHHADYFAKIGDLYRSGQPEIGIFRDFAIAHEYYQRALDDCSSDAALIERVLESARPYRHDPEDINFTTMHITGDESTLKQLYSLIVDNLHPEFGEKNCSGLFIPVGKLMKYLVCSEDYLGNIQSASYDNDTLSLTIESESDVPDAIRYALHEFFGNELDVKVCNYKDLL